MPNVAQTLRCLAVMLILVMTGCSADRRGSPSIGQVMTPGNTEVPLPPGDWKVLASEEVAAGTNLGGGTNNQHSVKVYYGKIENGRIVQVVYVSSSAGVPSAYGYGTGRNCLAAVPSDFVYFADPRNGSINAIDCVKVTGNRVFNPPGRTSSDIYRQAYENAKAYGGLPRFSVQVEIAEAQSLRYQDYYIYFFPNQSAAATRSADWRIDTMPPANRQFVDGVIGWAKDFRDAVRLGTQYLL